MVDSEYRMSLPMPEFAGVRYQQTEQKLWVKFGRLSSVSIRPSPAIRQRAQTDIQTAAPPRFC